MDWSGRCRRLRVGRVLNDNKCVTVPFPLIHATHLTFRLVGFALSLVPCLFYPYWFIVADLRVAFSLHSWLARASTLSPLLPLSHSPFSVPFPPVSISPLSHAYFHFSRTSQPKKLPSTKFLITHLSRHLSISHKHTFSHETSSSLFFCLYYFYIPRRCLFFSPVIIMCSLLPFFFLFRALFFLCFFLTLLHIDPSHCEHRHTFPFLPYDQPTLCRILLSM